MLITNRHISHPPKILIDDKEVRIVKKVKYLGIYIDDKLKYNSQIEHIENKLARLCGVSFRLKSHFNLDTAKKFYFSCVYGTLGYCLSNWGGASLCSSRCDRIQRLQKRIAENLFRKFHLNGCIFKAMKILKFKDIYRLKVATHMFKLEKLNCAPYLQNIINLSHPSHSHNTRSQNLLELPFPRVESIRMNFQYQF